ncbi:hypothetical protein KJ951_01175 [Patescibacteria group bacterium]|nr:hypothetical protein [Patescibacteria group bacterium]MBU1953693.1 hypothetical protein [Patescibacteria group bacterium]
MIPKKYICIVVILGSMMLSALTARALSSADYQINDFSEVPLGGTATSVDYRMIISPWDQNFIMPVVVPTPTPTPTPGGGSPLPVGGGGGGRKLENPTITTFFVHGSYDPALFPEGTVITHDTYGSTLLVEGTRPRTTNIDVNYSNEGVAYPDDDTWGVTRVVGYGENLFEVYAIFPDGKRSLIVSTIGFRRLIGDGNGNGIVDDYDLALLSHQWQTTQWESDFNMDGTVDDFDLAGMAAHWGEVMVYPTVQR